MRLASFDRVAGSVKRPLGRSGRYALDQLAITRRSDGE